MVDTHRQNWVKTGFVFFFSFSRKSSTSLDRGWEGFEYNPSLERTWASGGSHLRRWQGQCPPAELRTASRDVGLEGDGWMWSGGSECLPLSCGRGAPGGVCGSCDLLQWQCVRQLGGAFHAKLLHHTLRWQLCGISFQQCQAAIEVSTWDPTGGWILWFFMFFLHSSAGFCEFLLVSHGTERVMSWLPGLWMLLLAAWKSSAPLSASQCRPCVSEALSCCSLRHMTRWFSPRGRVFVFSGIPERFQFNYQNHAKPHSFREFSLPQIDKDPQQKTAKTQKDSKLAQHPKPMEICRGRHFKRGIYYTHFTPFQAFPVSSCRGVRKPQRAEISRIASLPFEQPLSGGLGENMWKPKGRNLIWSKEALA